MSSPTASPPQLRIGITGHRVLVDQTAVSDALERLFERLEALRPHAAWTAVSALASGADSIFAELVLGRARSRLEAILPFDAEIYRADFESPNDLARFERLLSLADLVRSPSSRERSLATVVGEGPLPAKIEAYRRAGEAVVDSCELLVTVWNGQRGGRGGTGDIVEYAVRAKRPVVWIDARSPADGPQYVADIDDGPNGALTVSTSPMPSTRRRLDTAASQPKDAPL